MRTLCLLFICVLLAFSGCTKSTNSEPAEGVLTTTQEETLKKAKELDTTMKKLDETRLQELNQAESKPAEDR